jgi:hypothetical protein
MKLEGLDTTVEIKLSNGVYQFDCESATGKTRLYDIIKSYQRDGYNVISFSYTDLQDGLNLEDVVRRVQPSLLMIDRYDMFSDMYHDVIEELSNKCIILIDSKEILSFGEYYLSCGIKMTTHNIEVYG